MSDDDAVWVRTQLIDNQFLASLEVDEDHSVLLDREHALKHAFAITTAVEYARMDSMIFKQLSPKIGTEAAFKTVHEIRQKRADIDFSVSAPFSLRPGMTQEGKPFLMTMSDDEITGQWELEDAESHALACISVTAIADLDTQYFTYLTNFVELDSNAAQGVVADLVRFR